MEQVQTITIDGMTCAACVTRVERVLKRVPGVTGAEVNLLAGTALIHGADVRFDTLAAAVTKAGYEAARPMPSSETVAGPDWWPVILAALLTAPLLASMVTMAWNGAMLPDPVAATLAGVVQINDPTLAEVNGDHAYVVAPSVITFKTKDGQMKNAGTFTFALVKGADGWKIQSWAYARGAALP